MQKNPHTPFHLYISHAVMKVRNVKFGPVNGPREFKELTLCQNTFTAGFK